MATETVSMRQARPGSGSVEVRFGGKHRALIQIDGETTTVQQLKNAIYETLHIRPYRQRIVFHHGPESTVLHDESKRLSDYAVKAGNVLHVKDLGPQVAWKTVFLLEYAGPLVIHQVMGASWRGLDNLTTGQLAAWCMVTFHYLKRLYETLFVHRFSHSTMPVSAMLRNCAHYWLVGGVALGWRLYRPGWPCSAHWPVYAAVFAVAELGNLYAHYKLRWLRPPGSRTRRVPAGFPFNRVSCPNYSFEVLAWVAFAAATGGLSIAWLFATAGALQMWLWARKKHAAYLKEFPGYPKNRTPMVPFLC